MEGGTVGVCNILPGLRSLPDFKSNPYQIIFEFPTPRIMKQF